MVLIWLLILFTFWILLLNDGAHFVPHSMIEIVLLFINSENIYMVYCTISR
ncbi:hypothetical protein ES332_D06G160100v1 [Gossypium tomentosum]|uniref:Uncharacterized protein n=1 Tax=Gossypium tomentosum TaxID=34277 RepID=A0A5D2KIW3_GOSTO|nr:hypothetical protein ES332_D06G160100v1 [Gossypium tomentosum]